MPHGPNCYNARLALADGLVARGDWASGHAIARTLSQCAQREGCDCRADCLSAASRLLDDIRALLED